MTCYRQSVEFNTQCVFSMSDADVLKERELYNRCTLDLSICRRGENIPSPRKKKCPRFLVCTQKTKS
ncbi:hypothetical protein HBI06_256810 [Parastagonospora nodorum]|nr:hypothetical protein HBI06_256810 [Parastagonospora nodorum]